MKRGLVIGKFMPLHKGHCALIRFAARHCDELIVSMTYKPDDPIPGPLRFEWIKEEFKDESSVRPEVSPDDFDDESLTIDQRMPLWKSFLSKRFPPIEVVFSSESYGQKLAQTLGVEHISFDPPRKQVSVSASLIRDSPSKYWDFIADSAKYFFVRKFCFYGSESTGKSTMAIRLAAFYNTEYVPEVSRELISSNEFSIEDIIRIGEAQTQRVIDKAKTANRFLFCDTDVITTQIYSRHYLNKVPEILYELEARVKYDRYFLFGIDVPWVADDIRDLGHRRDEMFSIFKKELDDRNIRYDLVTGNYAERESMLKTIIDSYLQ